VDGLTPSAFATCVEFSSLGSTTLSAGRLSFLITLFLLTVDLLRSPALFGFPLVVFASSGSGCHREDALAFICPSAADVLPVPDDPGDLHIVGGEQVGLESSKVHVPPLISVVGDQGLCSPTSRRRAPRVTE
jgi:hypothetical protein